MNSSKDEIKYTGKNIKVLKGIEAIQKHPGMYIGDTEDGSGLCNLVFEVIDNSVDEAVEYKHCQNITITFKNDHSIIVEDDGRGFPVDDLEDGRNAVEVLFTELHSGGKFDKDSYAFSGGLHGIGISAVNALCAFVHVNIKRAPHEYQITFKDGATEQKLTQIGSTEATGTKVHFKPSDKYFGNIAVNKVKIIEKVRYLAYLNEGLKIRIIDEESGNDLIYGFKGGMQGFFDEANGLFLLEKPIILSHKDTEENEASIEIAVNWFKEEQSDAYFAFTNNIRQIDGGYHLNGARIGLTKAICESIESLKLMSKKDGFEVGINDVKNGMFIVVDLKLAHPRFASQTKDKLISNKAKTVAESAGYQGLKAWGEANEDKMREVCAKCIHSAMLRLTAQKVKEQTSKKIKQFSALMQEGNYVGCRTNVLENKEIFLVEGVSAAGTAKQARNPENQAIYVLRGKVINVFKNNIPKAIASKTLRGVTKALGGTYNSDGSVTWKPAFQKNIILTDSDEDGKHLICLLMVFLLKFFEEMVKIGSVYVANPPLYRMIDRGKGFYFSTNEELNNYLFKKSKINPDLAQLSEAFAHAEQLAKSTGLSPDVMDKVIEYIITDTPDDVEAFGKMFVGDESEYDILPRKKTFALEHKITKKIQTIYPSMLHRPEFVKLQDALRKHRTIIKQLVGDDRTFTFLQEEKEACSKGAIYHRNKGLGELNPSQLKETAMDPKTRNITQVTMADLQATQALCEVFVGHDVQTRKTAILTNGMGADIDC